MDMSEKEFDDTLADLIKKGFVKKVIVNGEEIISVTEEGEAAFRETERINNKNNNPKINHDLN